LGHHFLLAVFSSPLSLCHEMEPSQSRASLGPESKCFTFPAFHFVYIVHGSSSVHQNIQVLPTGKVGQEYLNWIVSSCCSRHLSHSAPSFLTQGKKNKQTVADGHTLMMIPGGGRDGLNQQCEPRSRKKGSPAKSSSFAGY
jgi:hypothetical protein